MQRARSAGAVRRGRSRLVQGWTGITSTRRHVVWSYPEPQREAAEVTGRIAFFNERVDLVVDGTRRERPVTPWSPRSASPPQRWSSPAGIGSASAARPGEASKGSAKYWVSCLTSPSANSMMLTE
jgi:Domain of unknown function (DUF427)